METISSYSSKHRKPGTANRNNRSVVACIPYYQCQRYIRRAVLSLLKQTHENITVVVLNDADFHSSPWPALEDIHDHRLVRFNLAHNKGPYFATQVALEATSASYLLIQDADDWSHPERVTHLLAALEQEKADLAISAQPQFYEALDGSNQVVGVRWLNKASEKNTATFNNDADRFRLDTQLTAQFRSRSPHHGLFRTDTLRAIGGYYGGFRFNYDVLLTNLILMIGKIVHTSKPLYHRLVRPTSLTQSPETGIRSAQRNLIAAKTSSLYQSLYKCYQAFLKGQLTSGEMAAIIKHFCGSNISALDAKILKAESQRLKQQFALQACG